MNKSQSRQRKMHELLPCVETMASDYFEIMPQFRKVSINLRKHTNLANSFVLTQNNAKPNNENSVLCGLKKFNYEPNINQEKFQKTQNNWISKHKQNTQKNPSEIKKRQGAIILSKNKGAVSFIANNEKVNELPKSGYKIYNDILETIIKTREKENKKIDAEIVKNQGNSKEKFPKTKITDYLIGEQIGQGAYSIVKEAVYLPKNKQVALKIYDKQKFDEPRKKRRLLQEIDIMNKLNHKNIIKLYEVVETQNHYYLVLELVKGKSLHQLIRGKDAKKLSENEVKNYFKQIISAIKYCHSMNISHRDIKLENILLDTTNQIKIIDFGFSMKSSEKLHNFSGTPSYMSPEIIMRKDHYGQFSDIWALGILLYVMICGVYPYKGKNEKELFEKIKQGELNFPENISENAKSLITKCLNPAAEKRPTAEEILMNEKFLLN